MSKKPYTNLRVLSTTSGRNVGRNATRVFGCEECNFMMEKKTASLSKDEIIKNLKTGSDCPRCGCPSIRDFDSLAEHGRACELKLLRDNAEIEDLEFQTKFDLHAHNFETGEPVKIGTYVADFTYFENVVGEDGKILQNWVVEDVKNKAMMTTDVSKWKLKHYQAEYGNEVRLIGR